MSKSRTIVSGIIIVLVVFGGWFAIKSYLSVENPFYVVSSESMVPSLQRGDGVIIRNGDGFSFGDLQTGDIIVFHTNDGGGRVIIHRIADVYFDKNNHKVVKTKGDANPQSYEGLDYPIVESDYYGKVIFTIPKIGALRYLGS